MNLIVEDLAERMHNYRHELVADESAAPLHARGRAGRVVFLIGAGASNAAAGLPLGRELAADLRHRMECSTEPRRTQLEGWLDQMVRDLHFDRDDFKTILFSLNKIDSPSLVRLVQEALLHAVPVCPVYDRIARLFKARYADGIVNFNFDELMDAAIVRAFGGTSGYKHIYSEETVPAGWNDGFAHLPEDPGPVYVKPHGTISRGETLRFARKEFWRIQQAQANVMRSLFSGKNVTVVLVGFRLKFFELSTLLPKWLDPTSEIVIIDRNEDVLDDLVRPFYRGKFLRISEMMKLDTVLLRLSEAVAARTIPQLAVA